MQQSRLYIHTNTSNIHYEFRSLRQWTSILNDLHLTTPFTTFAEHTHQSVYSRRTPTRFHSSARGTRRKINSTSQSTNQSILTHSPNTFRPRIERIFYTVYEDWGVLLWNMGTCVVYTLHTMRLHNSSAVYMLEPPHRRYSHHPRHIYITFCIIHPACTSISIRNTSPLPAPTDSRPQLVNAPTSPLSLIRHSSATSHNHMQFPQH